MKRPLPESVRTVSWVSFFTDIASEMAYPVIPLFLVTVLKAPVVVLGATEGLAEAIVSLMKGWSGWHSDLKGRRVPYIRWGYGLAAISKPLIALAPIWPVVTFARALDRFGKGLRTSARDALIADAVTSEDRGRAFGYHRAMDTAGAFIGTMLVYLLFVGFPGDYRRVFALAAIPGILAVVLTFRLREPVRPEPAPVAETPAAAKPEGGFSPAYYRVVALFALFALANSSDTFLLLKAGQSGLDVQNVVLAYALYNLIYAAGSLPLGKLSDRLGRMPVLAGGWTLYGLTYFGFALFGGHAIWLLMGLYGLYMAATDGVGKSLLSRLAPAERRGTAIGMATMVTGLVALLGNVAAGLLWDHVGPAAPFWFGGGVACVTAVLAPFLAREPAV